MKSREVEGESEALTEDGSGECLLPISRRVQSGISARAECLVVYPRALASPRRTGTCALSGAGARPWAGGGLCRPACVGGEGSRGVNDPPPARPA